MSKKYASPDREFQYFAHKFHIRSKSKMPTNKLTTINITNIMPINWPNLKQPNRSVFRFTFR